MLALRKRRMAAAPPFLRGGFRPFFFGAAVWAVIAIGLWLSEIAGLVALPSGFEGVAWHRHEMLLGFVGAAVSGFLLTAIPNCTGRLPIAGKPLLALFGIWAAARIAVPPHLGLGIHRDDRRRRPLLGCCAAGSSHPWICGFRCRLLPVVDRLAASS